MLRLNLIDFLMIESEGGRGAECVLGELSMAHGSFLGGLFEVDWVFIPIIAILLKLKHRDSCYLHGGFMD